VKTIFYFSCSFQSDVYSIQLGVHIPRAM